MSAAVDLAAVAAALTDEQKALLGDEIAAAKERAWQAEQQRLAEERNRKRRERDLADNERRAGPLRAWAAALEEGVRRQTAQVEALQLAPEGETGADEHHRRNQLRDAERLLAELHAGCPYAEFGGTRGLLQSLGVTFAFGAPNVGLTRTRQLLAELDAERERLEQAG